MVKLELPKDFAEHIGKALGWEMNVVNEAFEFEETKDGYFIAQLKKGRSLSKTDFKTVCSLARDLGGEYVQGKGKWAIPGPYAKKGVPEPSPQPQPGVTTPPVTQQGVTPHSVSMDKSKPPELEVLGVEPSDEYFIAKSVSQIGYLYPILKDVHGNVIDGYHRLNIDPKWPIRKVEEVTDPVQLVIARLIANVCRRDVPAEEKTQWLKQIAELTGWTPKQIAANLPVSYTWVMKYLPDEFKDKEMAEYGRKGVKVKAEVDKRQATHRVTEQQFVPCARCGVATSQPIHLDRKFYCARCAKKIAAVPEGSFIEEPTTNYPPLPSEPTTAGPPELKPVEVTEPNFEDIDTGFEWICPECSRRFQLIHRKYRDGKVDHVFEVKQ